VVVLPDDPELEVVWQAARDKTNRETKQKNRIREGMGAPLFSGLKYFLAS
jgi:hypothetical protein